MVDIGNVRSIKFSENKKPVSFTVEKNSDGTYCFTATVKNDITLKIKLEEYFPSKGAGGGDHNTGSCYTGKFTITYDKKHR